MTQKQGVMTCIPKRNKNKQFLKNWRSISLRNVPPKLASGCIANRLKEFLPLIISEAQAGFIEGRLIEENIRTVYVTMSYAEKRHIPGFDVVDKF